MSANTEQRKLAAIMFTDMVGYSALSQRNEALALELIEEHRGVLRGLFPKHQGTEIKTTGDGVNIAARIEPLAEAGGICISNSVYDQIENKVEHALVRLSRPELKNIQASVQVYKLVLDGTVAADVRRRTRAGSQPSASSPRRLQLALGVVVLLVAGLLLMLKFGARPKSGASATSAPPSVTDQKSIAVLPFVSMSADKALDWLEKGYEEQDGFCWGLKVFPMFDPLRTEPRFQALLKKVGLDK